MRYKGLAKDKRPMYVATTGCNKAITWESNKLDAPGLNFVSYDVWWIGPGTRGQNIVETWVLHQ